MKMALLFPFQFLMGFISLTCFVTAAQKSATHDAEGTCRKQPPYLILHLGGRLPFTSKMGYPSQHFRRPLIGLGLALFPAY